MKLIFIYGPPASGKLTVGRALAEQTGYRLFHNHLTVAVGRSIFQDTREPYPEPGYSDLLKKLRLDCVAAAAEANIDLIFTLAYSGAVDDPFVTNIVEAVQSRQGSVHFVQLIPPDEILEQRIANQSRQEISKLTDVHTLRQVLAARDMRASVKYPDVLRIDTSTLDPAQSAAQITAHFRLFGA